MSLLEERHIHTKMIFCKAHEFGAGYVGAKADNRSIYYEGDDLVVHLLFESVRDAVQQRTAILGVSSGPLRIPQRDISISLQTINTAPGHSPNTSFQFMAVASDSTDKSTISLDSDLARFQMLENPNHPMLRSFRPERCHYRTAAKYGLVAG